MSLSSEERATLISLYLDKARATFEELEVAVEAKKWGMAANRMYYAVFHAVSALFVSEGLPVGSHRGAKAALGQHFVLTGKISQEYSKLFSQLETLRDKADYNIMFVASEENVLPFLGKASELINEVERIIQVSNTDKNTNNYQI